MPFLPPNQQRQSTEGSDNRIKAKMVDLTVLYYFYDWEFQTHFWSRKIYSSTCLRIPNTFSVAKNLQLYVSALINIYQKYIWGTGRISSDPYNQGGSQEHISLITMFWFY